MPTSKHIIAACLLTGFCGLLLPQTGRAQHRLSGLVVDQATDQALPSASVRIWSLPGAAIEGFALSDSLGRFTLTTRHANHPYLIITSALGYQNDTLALAPVSSPVRMDTTIRLQFDNYLEEVEVKAYRSGIVVNGDTVAYEPEVFTDGSERNLEELLRKLPGLNVSESGDIKVGQQEVGQVLLEGDPFMNSNRQGMLKGIRAADIAAVELISNYSATDLRGAESTAGNPNLALNIKLDASAHGRAKISANAGHGYRDAQRGRFSGYYLKRNDKIFLDVRANNTGERLLSLADYLRLRGDVFANGSSGRQQKIPGIFLDRSDATRQRGIFSSLNYSTRLTDQLRLSGYLFHYGKQRLTERRTTEVLSLADITNTYATESGADQHSFGGEIRTLYTISDQTRLKYTAHFYLGDERLENDGLAVLNDQPFSEAWRRRNRSFSLQQAATLTRQFSKRHQLSIQLFHQQQGDEQRTRLAADQPLPFSEALFGAPTETALQTNEDGAHNFGLLARHTGGGKRWGWAHTVEWRRHHYHLQTGAITPYSDLLPPGEQNWSSTTARINPRVTFNHKLGNLKGGVLLQYWRTPADRFRPRRYWRLHPTLSVRLQSKDQLNRLQFELNGETELSDFLLAPGATRLDRLNAFYQFSRSGQNAFPTLALSLLYSRFDPLAGSTLFLFSRFNRNRSVIDRPEFQPRYVANEQVLTPHQNLLMNGALFDKKLYELGLGLRTNILTAFQDRYAYTGEAAVRNRDAIITTGLSVFTVRDSAFNIQFDGRYRFGIYRMGENTLRGQEWQSAVVLSGFAAGRRFIWRAGLTHVYEAQAGAIIRYYNLNGRLTYQPRGRDWSLALVWNDLLNLNNPRRLSFQRTATALVTNQYALFPGFITLNGSFQL